MIKSLRRKTDHCELYENLHLWIKENCLSRDPGTEKETEILTN